MKQNYTDLWKNDDLIFTNIWFDKNGKPNFNNLPTSLMSVECEECFCRFQAVIDYEGTPPYHKKNGKFCSGNKINAKIWGLPLKDCITVSELISKLNEYDSNLPVLGITPICTRNGEFWPIAIKLDNLVNQNGDGTLVLVKM